jgi:hypothetical protein
LSFKHRCCSSRIRHSQSGGRFRTPLRLRWSNGKRDWPFLFFFLLSSSSMWLSH